MAERRLTTKQRMFIEQYFICDMNATEAAMIVYKPKSRDVARSMGAENLAKPNIRARVDARLAQFEMTANEVLARLSFHARGSMEDFLDADSFTLDLNKAKAAKQLGLIKKFKVTTIINSEKDTRTDTTEFELYDAQAALVHIGKHLGLFAADTNINLNLNNLSDEELRALAEGKRLINATVTK